MKRLAAIGVLLAALAVPAKATEWLKDYPLRSCQLS
jgi:hypothetical protein